MILERCARAQYNDESQDGLVRYTPCSTEEVSAAKLQGVRQNRQLGSFCLLVTFVLFASAPNAALTELYKTRSSAV